MNRDCGHASRVQLRPRSSPAKRGHESCRSRSRSRSRIRSPYRERHEQGIDGRRQKKTPRRLATLLSRPYVPDMDPITALNIAQTKERIALLHNLISQLSRKGHDVSEHRGLLAMEEAYLARGCTPRGQKPEASPTTTERGGGQLHHLAQRQMSEERPPAPLTPTEHVALQWIRAGKEPGKTALEAVVSRRWAKWVKNVLVITEAGEKALADDAAARMAMRSAQRPRVG
jgi:hypothetical protein